jgi:hypothetical protein
MPQVQLDDEVFKAAQRGAADGGYSTVDEYVADVVIQHVGADDAGETPNLDDLFTPERLAEIDRSSAEIDAGHFFTAEQVREHFRQKRAEWTQKNGDR